MPPPPAITHDASGRVTLHGRAIPAHDLKLMLAVLCSSRERINIDFQRVAALTGKATERTSRSQWSVLLKRHGIAIPMSGSSDFASVAAGGSSPGRATWTRDSLAKVTKKTGRIGSRKMSGIAGNPDDDDEDAEAAAGGKVKKQEDGKKEEEEEEEEKEKVKEKRELKMEVDKIKREVDEGIGNMDDCFAVVGERKVKREVYVIDDEILGDADVV